MSKPNNNVVAPRVPNMIRASSYQPQSTFVQSYEHYAGGH